MNQPCLFQKYYLNEMSHRAFRPKLYKMFLIVQLKSRLYQRNDIIFCEQLELSCLRVNFIGINVSEK